MALRHLGLICDISGWCCDVYGCLRRLWLFTTFRVVTNLTDETKSRNIYLTLSEHFSQFVSIKREKIEYKKLNIIQRDFSKFQSQQFPDDVSIQNWNSDIPNVNELFIEFRSKLQGCVERHAPL